MTALRHVAEARSVLALGGIIAYPTEAVFGLGCDPFSQQAVDRLLAFKQRPWQKGLILVVSDLQQLPALRNVLTPSELETLNHSWPGPTTWLLPDRQRKIPHWIKGEHDTVAVRVSDHPLVQRLCRAWGGAIVSTSANRTSQEPARTDLQIRCRVHAGLMQAPDYIVPGNTGALKSPTIIKDLVSGTVIRTD